MATTPYPFRSPANTAFNFWLSTVWVFLVVGLCVFVGYRNRDVLPTFALLEGLTCSLGPLMMWWKIHLLRRQNGSTDGAYFGLSMVTLTAFMATMALGVAGSALRAAGVFVTR